MPMSALGSYWPVVKTLIESKATSVLDVGCGTGRLGQVVRDYVEVLVHGSHPTNEVSWSMRVEGIEVFPDYRTPCWDVYDRVAVGDMWDLMPGGVRVADFVVALDVLEHVPSEEHAALLNRMLASCERGVIIGTPDGWEEQGAGFGNEHERHLSAVTMDTFKDYDVMAAWRGDGCLVVVLSKGSPIMVADGDLVMERIV